MAGYAGWDPWEGGEGVAWVGVNAICPGLGIIQRVESERVKGAECGGDPYKVVES